MAESIVRLQLDSSSYDANIKRATDGLMRYEQECRKVGGTLEHVEKETLDYVEALGDMETKSKSARGKVGELTKGFTELSMQYRRLTDEEKSSPYGEALAKSLETLKGRVKDARAELQEVEASLKDVNEEAGSGGLGGILDELAGKFGISTSALSGWSVALAAAAGALKVMTDAMKQNEIMVDAWGTITEQAGALYDGFLQALNSGDVNGYLGRIDDIVNAAREAYNALDELGTFNAFNQINNLRGRAEFQQARADARRGLISKEQAIAAGEKYKALIEDQAKKEQEAYDKKVKELAEQAGVDVAKLKEVLEGSYADYVKARDEKLSERTVIPTFQTSAGTVWQGKPVTEEYAETPDQKLGLFLKQFTDTKLFDVQRMGSAAYQSRLKVADISNQLVEVGNMKAPGGGGGAVVPAGPSMIGGNLGGIAGMGMVAESMGAADLGMIGRMLMEGLQAVPEFKEEKVPLGGQAMMKSTEELVGGLGQVAGGLESLGIELPEGVSKLLNGIGGLITVIQGISAVIVATQAIIEMNTATQFIPFANGGVVRAANGWVGGNSFSGDRVPALLNSGELVLNRAQQGHLASQLSGGGWENLRLETEIDGTKLRILLNNESRSRGKGYYLTGG